MTEPKPTTRTPATPWVLQEEKSGTRALATTGRIALWSVVALAAVTGVRSWFWPNEPAPAPPVTVDQKPTYPVQDAQAVASRFAYSYLTWDETDPDQRAKALARDMPKDTDTSAGWNAKGQQTVLLAQPGEVDELGGKRARVHVDVLVSSPGEPSKDKKKAPAPAERKWVGLEVPVLYTSGRIVVTSEPGIVGVPTSGPSVTDQTTAQSDVELSAQTQSTMETFFTEYAKGEADSVTAPGASVPPLPSGITFQGLQSWNVDQGKGSDRVGTAVVRWQIGAAELEQTYRVELTRVASAAAERWQVAEVHGGTY
ncbi:conjugal transfer protein [Streptomyces sp. NPDC048188]|uniref:conjugal transfer protein n=1 Tax=Streptomyces sp. NPDC048188 TaxID=3155749 RepID=UPI00342C0CA5